MLRNRANRRGELVHHTLENVFLSASTLLITLFTLLILFLGVFVFRAS
jgi:hypothetical protein